MLNARVKQLLSGFLLSVAAVLPAQSAVYTGNWDPAFGAAYPQLGWKGEASFSIPDACLALGAGNYFNNDACSQGGMQILSASVSLYQLGSPTNVLETIDFTVAPSPFYTIGMRVDGSNQLAGVTGLFDYFVNANVNLGIAGGIYASYGLQFQDNGAVLAIRSPYGLVSLSDRFAPDGNGPAAFITFTPAVPEPETYALVLAGLAAVIVLSRRRRR